MSASKVFDTSRALVILAFTLPSLLAVSCSTWQVQHQAIARQQRQASVPAFKPLLANDKLQSAELTLPPTVQVLQHQK
jgi:hypothetical protein